MALVRREATATEAEQLDTGAGLPPDQGQAAVRAGGDDRAHGLPDRIGALVGAAWTPTTSRSPPGCRSWACCSPTPPTPSAPSSATAEDARLLGIRPRAPLLRELRRSTDPDGAALEWSEDRYLGEAVAFTVHNSVHQNTLIRGLA